MTIFDLAFDPNQPRDPHTGEWVRVPGSWVVKPSNIVAMWDAATEGEKQSGHDWYQDAHKTALAFSKRYNVSLEMAAGILAEYSPQTAWGLNQIEASEVLRKHRGVGGPKASLWYSTGDPNLDARRGVMASGVQHSKADEILAGGDFDVVTAGQNKSGTIPPKGLKIRAFYHLIAAGYQDDPNQPRVVIDRHAMSVAFGKRVTEDDYAAMHPASQVTYQHFVDAYVEAARQISLREGRTVEPHEVQAATWLARQRLNTASDAAKARRSKALGIRDWKLWTEYAQRYLAGMEGAKVGYSDLATPQQHEVQQPPDTDVTVKAIAAVLVAGAAIEAQVTAIKGLLKPYAISGQAVALALGLVRRGTKTKPNSVLKATGADEVLTPSSKTRVRAARNHEMYYRASYVAHAARRIADMLRQGKTPKEALDHEAPYFHAHEHARKGRLTAHSQVEVAAEFYGWDEGEAGTLVGWYHNPFLNNEAECLSASGSNFYAEHGTSIGMPGSVHNNCGCYAGPPHVGAGMVDDAVRKVVKFAPAQRRPRFKLKSAG